MVDKVVNLKMLCKSPTVVVRIETQFSGPPEDSVEKYYKSGEGGEVGGTHLSGSSSSSVHFRSW